MNLLPPHNPTNPASLLHAPRIRMALKLQLFASVHLELMREHLRLQRHSLNVVANLQVKRVRQRQLPSHVDQDAPRR